MCRGWTPYASLELHGVVSRPATPPLLVLWSHDTGALFALKKKKMYEAEVQKIHGAMMNLESQVGATVRHGFLAS